MEERKGIIYLITNTVNNKKYVGQTTQLLNERWRRHVDAAFGGAEQILSCAIRKYGVEKFEIIELEKVELSRLDEAEIKYIKYYDTFGLNGYNMTIGGGGVRTITDEQAEKVLSMWQNGFGLKQISFDCGHKRETLISVISQYGITDDEFKQRRDDNLCIPKRKVVQIRFKDSAILNVFDSTLDAEKFTKVDHSMIIKCCTNELASAGNYYWRYFEDMLESDLISMKYTEDLPEKFGKGSNVERRIDYDLVLKLWNKGLTQNHIANLTNCTISGLATVLDSLNIPIEDRMKRAVGSRSIPVVQLNQKDQLIRVFISINEASRTVRYCHKIIKECIKGNTSYKGFKWKYKTDYERELKEKISSFSFVEIKSAALQRNLEVEDKTESEIVEILVQYRLNK